MTDPFEDIQLKRTESTENTKEDSGLPDSLKEMLVEALGKTAHNAQRARCLEMALKLPHLSSAQEAIQCAEIFRKYIMDENK